jgi:hypothetical protein
VFKRREDQAACCGRRTVVRQGADDGDAVVVEISPPK